MIRFKFQSLTLLKFNLNIKSENSLLVKSLNQFYCQFLSKYEAYVKKYYSHTSISYQNKIHSLHIQLIQFLF
jgi:hypothetical protein